MGDRNITVTLKAGEGFTAPWVVLGGDTLQEINHQLDTILQAGTLQKAAQIAIAFSNGYRAARHESQGYEQEPPAETYSQPPVGAGQPQQAPPPAQNPWDNQATAQQAPQGQQEPPWNNWSSNPQQAAQQPPAQPQGAQQGWGQQPQQQAAAPAPGGAPVCQCRKVMEHKVTGGGKPVWRCPDWRWNNGSPTPNHDQIWVDGN